jgi:hypothetical protein
MARGYIGESGADRALDKMDKFMQRKKEQSKGASTLLEQLKAVFPDTWEEELDKMKKEHRAKNPQK